MQLRRGIALLACTLLLGTSCSGGASFYSVRFGSNESLIQQREKGLTIYTATRTYNGKPKEISQLTTPIAIELRNDGPYDTVVMLPHFVLVDDKGRRYRPLTVYTDPPVKRQVPGVRAARANLGSDIPQTGETWSEEASGRVVGRKHKTTVPAGAYQVDELPTEGETWHRADRARDPDLEKLELTVTEKTAPIDPGPAPDGPAKPPGSPGREGLPKARTGGGTSTTPPRKFTDPKQRFAKPSKIKFGTVPDEVVQRRLRAGPVATPTGTTAPFTSPPACGSSTTRTAPTSGSRRTSPTRRTTSGGSAASTASTGARWTACSTSPSPRA
jgi:hypothetical protein